MLNYHVSKRPAFQASRTYEFGYGHCRRALTLVELLVVMSIMVLLAALIAPTLQPMMADRKVQEGSRQVHVFLSKAQARAIQLKRPVSVWIERAGPGSNFSTQLFIAESPQRYTGDTTTSTATVGVITQLVNPDTGLPYWQAPLTFGGSSTLAPFVLKSGDRIRFNYRSDWYHVQRVNPSNTTTWLVRSTQNPLEPQPPTGIAMPFQIERQPEKTSAKPLTLPTGVVIDLWFSGTGNGGFGLIPTNIAQGGQVGLGVAESGTATTPILITFNPEGAVQSYSFGATNSEVTSVLKMHLLVGRIEQAGAPADPTNLSETNLADPTTIWVSVEPNSGKVTSADNAPDDAGSISVAREFARKGESNTGR